MCVAMVLANRADSIHGSSVILSNFTIRVLACHSTLVPGHFREAKLDFSGKKDLKSEMKDRALASQTMGERRAQSTWARRD